MISGEASIELKRALKKMTPKDITALQSRFDLIDSCLEPEKLLENAVPLDHTSGLADTSAECQRALNAIHSDIDMEAIAKHAKNASITQNECLLILRRNQVAKLIASFLKDLGSRSNSTVDFASYISTFISVSQRCNILYISRNCY